MNLILSGEMLASTSDASDKADGWLAYLPCLARRHRLFLLLPKSSREVGQDPLWADKIRWFQGIRTLSESQATELEQLLAAEGLHPDETAYITPNKEGLEAALEAGMAGWGWVENPASQNTLASSASLVLQGLPALEAEMARREWAASRVFPVATVGALILDEAEAVFLVRTRKWSGLWGIPGGKVDYGETLEAAIRREIREETGLSLFEVRFAFLQDSIESPEFYRPRHYILANYAGRVLGMRPPYALNHESLDGAWVTLDEAEKMALNSPTRKLIENYRLRGGWPGMQGAMN